MQATSSQVISSMSFRGSKTDNNTNNTYDTLFNLVSVEISPRHAGGFLRGLFLAIHLASTDSQNN